MNQLHHFQSLCHLLQASDSRESLTDIIWIPVQPQPRGWGVEVLGWGIVTGSSTKTALQKGKQRDSNRKKASQVLVWQMQSIRCDDFNTSSDQTERFIHLKIFKELHNRGNSKEDSKALRALLLQRTTFNKLNKWKIIKAKYSHGSSSVVLN